MGLLGLAGSLLGMIPKVGSPKGAKKGKSGGSKGKSTKKSAKKSTKKKGSTKKKQRKPSKKKKKKRKKKWGKFFTKARKLKNSLSKSKLVKRVKKAVKKAVLATKKTAKKAAKAAKKATKAAVQTVKKAATVAVKASKKITGGTVAKVASAYSSFKEGGWKEAVSVAVDFIPVVGNAKALYESVSGKDPITGRKLGKTERLVSAGAVLLGPAAKAVKHGGKAVTKMVSGGSKGKTNPQSLTKPKEQAAKQDQSKTKPSQQTPTNKQQTTTPVTPSTSKGNTPSSVKNEKSNGTNKVPEGYIQDSSGRWHRPNGGYASNKEVGLPEPSGLSKRLEYMGSTPGKDSKTGREVIERMENEIPPKIRATRDGEREFMASNEKWYPIDEADMAHLTDAVSWWNREGRYYGAKSPEVREWMLDSNNYILDHYSLNRSAGAKLKETYLPPI